LVDDALVVVRGGEGAVLRWDAGADVYALQWSALPPAVASAAPLEPPAALAAFVRRIGGVGWLYRRVTKLAAAAARAGADVTTAAAVGSGDTATARTAPRDAIAEACWAAVRAEVSRLDRLVAVLEADVRGATSTPVSLRRVVVWCEEVEPGLSGLAWLADACASVAGGGALLTILHQFAQHGDPAIAQPATRVLAAAAGPWVSAVVHFLCTSEVRYQPPLPAGGSPFDSDDAAAGGPAAAAGIGHAMTGAPSPLEATALQWATTAAMFVTDRGDGAPDTVWAVADSSDGGDGGGGGKYALLQAQVPRYMPSAVAREVVTCGQAVHFLRTFCGDHAWLVGHVFPLLARLQARATADPAAGLLVWGTASVGAGIPPPAPAAAAAATAEVGSALPPPPTPASVPAPTAAPMPAAAVQEAVEAVMTRQRRLAVASGPDAGGGRFVAAAVELVAPLLQARVLSQLVSRSALLRHLGAMHRFQLLTAGDFASVLIAGIAPELNKPGTSTAIARHSLESVLESAIRGSNAAREDDEVLRRLSVRILPPSPGETGWDVFALQYDLPPPLLTVVTTTALEQYGRLFHYLFRLKRLEHALAATWAAHMTASHALRTARHGGLNRILHMCHLLRGDMTNFVANTMSYIMFEVLAAAWDRFRDAVERAGSVNHVTTAHAALITTILAHCLIDVPTLAALVGDCLRFCALQQAMVTAALQAVQDRRAAEAAMAARTAAGGWGIPAGVADLDALDDRLAAALDALVASYGPRIARIARGYRASMSELVAAG